MFVFFILFFFFNLYTSRKPTYPPDGEGQWGEAELRRRLAEIGERRLTMLVTSDGSRSWAIYMSEGLDEVLAYHGRSLPGPRYSQEGRRRLGHTVAYQKGDAGPLEKGGHT